MAASLAYGSGGSWFDPTTGAVKAVSLYYYRGGTEDPITVYTTSDLSIPHAIPVLSTGHGRVPPVWIGDQPDPGYRVRVFDQWSVLVEDVDNIPTPAPPIPPPEPDVGILPGDPRLYATGDIVMSFSNAQPRAGFVLCNGGSIGKTGSTNVVDGGRANDDTKALFEWLWGQDLYGLLPVLPSRGATATGDFNDGKAIRTPDLMGRFPIGMDAMGAPAKNRLAGITFAAGDQAKVGSYGGAAPIKTLTLAEMPAHNHGVTDPKHSHAGSGTTAGESVAHTHALNFNTSGRSANHTHTFSGQTDIQGAHSHAATGFYAGGGAGSVNYSASGPVLNKNEINTQSAGAHQHGYSGTTSGESVDHVHAVIGTSAGNSVGHTHTYSFTTDSKATGITVNSAGSGASWTLMSPFLQLCFHIKL